MEEQNVSTNASELDSTTAGGNTEQTTAQPEQTNSTVETKTNEVSTPNATATTFTQAQVDEIVSNRLKKEHERIFKRYNVADFDECDSFMGKAQAYDVMKERYDQMQTENVSNREYIALLKNNIKPEKYDEVKAYFKGKGVELTEEALSSEMSEHDYWLNTPTNTAQKTTITKLGAEATEKPKFDEKELASKIFGVKF